MRGGKSMLHLDCYYTGQAFRQQAYVAALVADCNQVCSQRGRACHACRERDCWQQVLRTEKSGPMELEEEVCPGRQSKSQQAFADHPADAHQMCRRQAHRRYSALKPHAWFEWPHTDSITRFVTRNKVAVH